VPLRIDLSGTQRPIGITTRLDWVPTIAQKILIDEIKISVNRKAPSPPED
jgi:LysR family transcriptional regulator, regulator for genes of the gallate degradation pathway